MAKKFSIKKLAAGVLALLMVVTALPVSGIAGATAKAADVVNVYRSYNPNSGEHFMTIDKAEHDSVVKAGRSDEGTAWIAPAESDTAIYRSYNPNTGEHLLVPKDEAEWLATQGWNNEGIKIYSADATGTPIYRLYNPNATDAGTHLYTADKDEAQGLIDLGWKADYDFAPVFYGVSDLSDVVTLTDINGLQDDGTALVGDTLQIIFGSSLGIPKSVVWYKSGAVVKTNVSGTLAATSDFSMDSTETAKLGAGVYYAIIENTQGDTYQTNSIVVADEGVAVITEFSIEDDYDTPAVTIDKDTNTVIVNVSLNKDYKGDFYIAESKTKDFTTAPDYYACAGTTTHVSAANHTAAELEEVKKASDFTNRAATAVAKAASAKDGLKYVDSEGTAHYKFVVSKLKGTTPKLARGTEYVIIFDQENISSDDVGIASSKKENLNISETFTCPYVTAPDKIAVTDKQDATDTKGWTATLYLGESVAKYINITKANEANIGGVTLYEGTSTDVSQGTAFTKDAEKITEGKADNDTSGECKGAGSNDEEYVYAVFTAVKGIFGEEALKLVSDVAGIPTAIATEVTISESTEDAKDIVVKFENLKNAANIFLLTADYNSGNSGTDTIKDALTAFANNGTYVAVMPAKKGAASITFDDVLEEISDKTHGDYYTVVVVPENTEDYRSYGKTATEAAKASTKIEQNDTTYVLEKTAHVNSTTPAVITVKDQFGDKIESASAIKETSMTPAAKNTGSKGAKFAMAADGKVTITAGETDDTLGDIYSLDLNGKQKIYIKVTNVTSNTADKWDAWIE